MTSHLHRYQALCATNEIRRQPALGSDHIDADSGAMDPGSELEMTRRPDGYEEEAPDAAAALFAGLLLGAGSTALMFGLATLLL